MDNDRAEIQKSKRDLVCRLKADAEKKYDKYWYEFQVSGSTSSGKTAKKYEDLITVCDLALQGFEVQCSRCRTRRHNGCNEIVARPEEWYHIDEKLEQMGLYFDKEDIEEREDHSREVYHKEGRKFREYK